MSDLVSNPRRQLVKLLGSVPMLPLASLGSSLALPACGGSGPTGLASASFTAMAAPSLTNPAAMATTSVCSALNIGYTDGSARSYKLGYQPFFLTGTQVPDGQGGTVLAGAYYDIHNRPIIDSTVPGKERQFFSDSPDGMSLLKIDNPQPVAGAKGQLVFAVVQFEYTTWAQDGVTDMYGKLPSPIAVLTLDQDPATGKLTLLRYSNVDTSAGNGLWITCASSQSPWGTHLSSEEYEPDAFSIASNAMFKAYSQNLFGDETKANPYHYGHLPEVSVNPDGTGTLQKHYCLGRISHELIQVMPDKRTALMGDDATNGGLFMFVADREKDLSSGSLYVAKFAPGWSIDPSAPAAAVSWIQLGSATSAEVLALANTLKPTDIFERSTTDPADGSFTKIRIGGKVEWVRLKPGMDKAAAFLETHRYAALKGASMAFTKMEGTTVNIQDKIAYSVLQNVQSSMVRNHAAWDASFNITVEKALNAGCILTHSLAGGQKDSSGNAIQSDWVVSQTRTLLIGEDLTSADALGNLSHPDKIAAPDNLKFSEKLRTLFIGEDSSYHVNNFVWAYQVDTQVLSRVASMPAGAEATGLGVVDDLNGWTYITGNFQHPGDWITNASGTGLHDKVKATLDPLIRQSYNNRFSAAVGYLTTTEATQVKLAP